MRTVLKFFFLTVAVSWLFFAAAAYIIGGKITPGGRFAGVATFLFILGTLMPAAVAVVLTAWAEGYPGIASLLGRIGDWRKRVRWYVFALGYYAAVKLSAALVFRLATGTWPPFDVEPWYVIATAIIVSVPILAGEEIGWRGFALPRLAGKFGLGSASIILGVIWAVWHLPLFLIPGSIYDGQSFWVFVLAVTAISVAMTWLFWHTDGSLLLMLLMHAAINNTPGTEPAAAGSGSFNLSASLVSWLTAAILWIAAAYLLFKMRGATLMRSAPDPDRVARVTDTV